MMHPEEQPDLPPLSSFTFSLEAGKSASHDLDLQIEALRNRISRISGKVEINGMAALQALLGLTHDQHKLTVLGKALVTVAPLIAQLDELESRKKVIEFAVNEPQWLAATFADLSDDVDNVIINTHNPED